MTKEQFEKALNYCKTGLVKYDVLTLKIVGNHFENLYGNSFNDTKYDCKIEDNMVIVTKNGKYNSATPLENIVSIGIN